MMSLRKEYQQLKIKLGINNEVECSEAECKEYRELLKEGKPLPKGVFRCNEGGSLDYAFFNRIIDCDLTAEELQSFIQHKQLKTLITIKKCIVFFTTLTVISLIGGIISALLLLLS